MPRSADKTLLNHSTVRGYLYWPTDHYTQETGLRSSKSSCRDSDGYDFSAKHCTLFDFVLVCSSMLPCSSAEVAPCSLIADHEDAAPQ